MTEQKPVAWVWRYGPSEFGRSFRPMLTPFDPRTVHDPLFVHNVRPLYEHPAPAQPATGPAVEAARRKALRAILELLDGYPWACDTAPLRTDVTFGVLRDLVGQPRKYPDRAILGYDDNTPAREIPIKQAGAYGPDDEPAGQVPEKGPEQPLPMPGWVIDGLTRRTRETMVQATAMPADALVQRRPPARLSVERLTDIAIDKLPGSYGYRAREIAKAVHAAIYGQDAE